jgi:hypothetical protein
MITLSPDECDASATVSRRRITNGTHRFTLAKLGVHYDRDYFTLLQLTSTTETSVLEIPAREEGAIFIAVLLASRLPYVGITNSQAHFVSFSQRISTQLPTLQDELHDLERRLVVDCLVLRSWRLSAYSKATVTHQKEYA